MGRLSTEEPSEQLPILLPQSATIADLHRYIHALEAQKGWLDTSLVDNCFLMGEEVGELFKAVRLLERFAVEQVPADVDASAAPDTRAALVGDVAFEIVDILNYLIAIANRLDIDLEDAFRKKNALNQKRSWSS